MYSDKQGKANQSKMREIYANELVTTVLVTILFSFVFFLFATKKLRKRIDKLQVPPGSNCWTAVVGDSISWYNAVASSHPPLFVQQRVKRYGKIFSCNLFGRRAVVSADPNFNWFVMVNEGKLFQSSYPKSFRDLVGKKGIITVQGEQQRKLHAIASNLMRLHNLELHFLNDIQMIIIRTLNHTHNNQLVLLQDVCRKVAINLMVNQLLGVSSEEEINEMAQLFSDFVDGCLSVPINLPAFAYHTAMKAREKIISKIYMTIEKQKKGEASKVGNGVLGRLLKEENLGENDAVADFIINLLFAGTETTAKTMLFAVYFLTQCPQALTQLLEEHDSVRHNSGEEMRTWQDYKAMPFTQCVIDETLRLGGIAIWLMREAKEDISYQDFVIPKGCFVVPFLSAVHLDENLYKEPTSFDPWRWMNPHNEEKKNWRNNQVFSPFGGGGRLCPGADLARLQIALFLHHFVTSYRWTQVKEDRMSFFPSARLVNGFQIRLINRQESREK